MEAKPGQEQAQFSFRYIYKSLVLQNRFTLIEINEIGGKLIRSLKDYKRDEIEIDLSGITNIDSAGVVFINHLRQLLEKKDITVKIAGASKKIQKVIDTFSVPDSKVEETFHKVSIFERIGDHIYSFVTGSLRDYVYMMADLFYWTFSDFLRSKAHRRGESINQAVIIGVNALPIVGLISFLIGLVLALQSAAQLRQFGANVFIVDLIVVAMTAEMGPLLTAIMIAGRSGSAIASEIATMKVTEETDALTTMGLNPIRYIVVPKMQASICTLPILTLMADILGILGGMLVAYLYLDVSFLVFYHRMAEALLFRDLLTGFIKSLVFAGLIVQTGAFFGFHVTGGSEGVGKSTTAAVVTSIFLVILADSILGLIFY